jgi:hypothetical protein
LAEAAAFRLDQWDSSVPAWHALVGRRFVGPPTGDLVVLAKGAEGPDEVVLLGPRSTPSPPNVESLLRRHGVTEVRPTALRRQVDALRQYNVGIFSLNAEGTASPAIGAALAVRVVTRVLGDEAVVGQVDSEARYALFGGAPGAFAVGADADRSEVRLVFAAVDADLAANRWAAAPLKQAMDLVGLCAGRSAVARAARRVLARVFDDLGGTSTFVVQGILDGRSVTAKAYTMGPPKVEDLTLGEGVVAVGLPLTLDPSL